MPPAIALDIIGHVGDCRFLPEMRQQAVRCGVYVREWASFATLRFRPWRRCVRERSERRILKALEERQREAYVGVIDAHYRSVYRFLLFLGHDAHLAEDLTQEVFASAWRSFEGFRGASSIRTWLHRIAYHAFVDATRRCERDKLAADALGCRDCAVADDPLAGIVADEHLRQLGRAMEHLDIEERTVLLLHYSDGLSYREMGEVLGRPDGTLKWVTSRALEKLRKQLGGKVEPWK